ncbi:MAG: hypothetical protein V2I33_13100 [Kangiellaceae bacterium]|jgi:TPR repeat protein|nr:hypothetical protein [Kangiellaceae bacterium]
MFKFILILIALFVSNKTLGDSIQELNRTSKYNYDLASCNLGSKASLEIEHRALCYYLSKDYESIEKVLRLKKKPNSIGKLLIAENLYYGRTLKQDRYKATQILKAIIQSNDKSLSSISFGNYLYKIGLAQLALKLLNSEQSNDLKMKLNALLVSYKEGLIDIDAIKKGLRDLSDKGLNKAAINLANIYLLEGECYGAESLLKGLQKKGVVEAEESLAYYYFSGCKEIKPDYERAILSSKKLLKAYESKEVSYILARSYKATKNYNDYISILESSVFESDEKVNHQLGLEYLEGVAVEKDNYKSIDYFYKGSLLGYKKSMIVISRFYKLLGYEEAALCINNSLNQQLYIRGFQDCIIKYPLDILSR